MKKVSADNKKLLKKLNTELQGLQTALVQAHKLEGKDDYIAVKVRKSEARFERIKKKGEADKAVGHFFIEIDITAKQQDVFIPISIASGKKTAGFMYQIEGTGIATIASTGMKIRGDGVLQVTLGTLLYAKIPAGKTASVKIQAIIRGALGKQYKIVFTRLNYKLHLADARYQQYLKEIHTDSVSFS